LLSFFEDWSCKKMSDCSLLSAVELFGRMMRATDVWCCLETIVVTMKIPQQQQTVDIWMKIPRQQTIGISTKKMKIVLFDEMEEVIQNDVVAVQHHHHHHHAEKTNLKKVECHFSFSQMTMIVAETIQSIPLHCFRSHQRTASEDSLDSKLFETKKTSCDYDFVDHFSILLLLRFALVSSIACKS